MELATLAGGVNSLRDLPQKSQCRAHRQPSILSPCGLGILTISQRQTIVSQFFQLDKLVVEGQKTVSSQNLPATDETHILQGKETGDHGGIVRQKDTGFV